MEILPTRIESQLELFRSSPYKPRVVVVEDNEMMRQLFTQEVESMGCLTAGFDSARKARDHLAKNAADLVLLDVYLNGDNGLEFLKELREKGNLIPVIIVSAMDKIQSYQTAMRLGASDYLVKPFTPEELSAKISACLQKSILNKSSDVRRWAENGVIGTSPKLLKAMRMAEFAAGSDINVLITGESGSGKEKFAQVVHNLSPRSKNRFIAVNSAGINDTLLNSELFGYRKGAFTGADTDRQGLIKEADGGTLFLDEIGDMGLAAQVKLLRVIETGAFYPVGDPKLRTANVRYITATHHDLNKDIEEGTFRLDLFFRLKGFEIKIPPLRERPEDIPLLVDHFLSRDNPFSPTRVLPDVLEAMREFPWPGNVRQLETMINVAKVTSKHQTLKMEHFPELFSNPRAWDAVGTPPSKNAKEELAEVEKHSISNALETAHGSVIKAAELLGMTRSTLYRKIKKYDIPHAPSQE